VDAEFEYDNEDDPKRMTDIRVKVTLPAGVAAERLNALPKVADACIVHQSLLEPPQTEISLVQPDSA